MTRLEQIEHDIATLGTSIKLAMEDAVKGVHPKEFVAAELERLRKLLAEEVGKLEKWLESHKPH